MSSASPTARTPVRSDLADLEPYGAPQLDVPVRINTNETASPQPASFTDEVARRLGTLELNRYPDRTHAALRELLAARAGLTVAQTWAANGSNEVLTQVLQAYGGPGRKLATVRPGYSMYPNLARITGTEFVEVDLDEDFRLGDEVVERLAAAEPHVVFLANPNNPTGLRVEPDLVRRVHDAIGHGLLVMDEAYVEFGGTSALDHVGDWERLVVSRTFSKAFGLAGLRLGYLHAPDWVVHDLRRVRLPYHLDSIKQVAAEVALEQEHVFLARRRKVATERDRVHDALAALDGVHVWPSDANFLLFRVADASGVFSALLHHGVLVRDFSRAPRLEGCLRATIGTPADNDRFLAALRTVLEPRGPGVGVTVAPTNDEDQP